MTALLRVVLDQVVAPTEADLGAASRELARALVRTAPSGCAVEGIVPHAADGEATLERAVPGLEQVTKVMARRELAAAWQLGVAPGVAHGMIHAPTLLAPLVRHDRVNENDQTVVTMWGFGAWEHPQELSRGVVLWHKAMLKRAMRFADAVVVPTHAAAARLGELGSFGERIRVIAGSAPDGFRVPVDDVGRRRALELPDGFLLAVGSDRPSERLADAFAAVVRAGVDLPLVVMADHGEDDAAVLDLAGGAGLDASRVHVLRGLDAADRGAVFAGAVAMLAPSRATDFPWRVVEAIALGVPVVAADTPTHREVILDGGLLGADAGALGESLSLALRSTEAVERLSVLAADRGRAFSWLGAAERVWQLHADL